MDWKEIMISVLAIVFVFALFSSCGGNEDGGKCKYCGKQTNWTYKNGGYICPACD